MDESDLTSRIQALSVGLGIREVWGEMKLRNVRYMQWVRAGNERSKRNEDIKVLGPVLAW